jgi:hypothetical protein
VSAWREHRVERWYPPVGALVRSGYWRSNDRVLAHNDNGSVTVQGDDGRVRTHMTPFNHGRWEGDSLADTLLEPGDGNWATDDR